MYLSNARSRMKVTPARSFLKLFFLVEHSFEKNGAKVALASVGKNRDNGFSFHVRFLRNADGRDGGGSAGDTGQNALFARQTAGHVDGFFVRYQFYPIDKAYIESIRDKARPETLDFMRTRLDFFAVYRLQDDRARHRLYG